METLLDKGMHGNMEYMARHFERLTDPSKLLPGARSVITFLINYFPETAQTKASPKISKYAYGKDYHEVITEKLNHFFY